MAGQDYTPQEISAIILKRLKSIAEARVGRDVPQGGHHGARVFLRCSAPGDPRGRRNRRAGGGAHNQRTHRCRTGGPKSRAARGASAILVYYLGGGTFDVSVVRIEQGVVEVISSHGNNHLGGDDFDQKIVAHVLEHLKIKALS